MPDLSQAKILLHICCGPCSIMPVTRLMDMGYEVIGWFMNPNIQPLAEYLRRREGAAQCAERLGIKIIFEDDWNLAAWLGQQLPRADSPERCHWCCEQRLTAAHKKAVELNIPWFCTSLLYSRYQPHEFIAQKGLSLEKEGGTRFFYQDFREDWQLGIDISREWAIYRQPYCGCVFSENERYAKKLAKLKNEKNF